MADFRHHTTKAVRSAEQGSPEYAELTADPSWVELVDPASVPPDADAEAHLEEKGPHGEEKVDDGPDGAPEADIDVPPDDTVTEPPTSESTTTRASRR
jgi:hypothetical protein